MLFALIPIAWLTVVALCWAACAAAARGDVESSPHAGAQARARRRNSATGDGLVVWEGLPELMSVRSSTRLTAHGVH